MIAYCGIECFECPAYIATKADDDKLREDAAKLWSGLFKHEIRPDQINCNGCKSDGKKFFFCRICGIKKCVEEKKLETCAYCDDFGCEKIEGLMQMDPNVKKSLEEQRQKLGK
ncbi:MAG: DUF3795 domain-containing protein [Dehalococcoidia bacterium]|nr:MAG: DUF3795 domain-containing protein [Dehalococcoidia bacterium]